jgi:hypothetical protein
VEFGAQACRQALELDFFGRNVAACRGAVEVAGFDYVGLSLPY